ncbi:MAG TPA: tetratricopeptide repeat protein [Acidobacteriaceae bacterium]|jgi:hypothetical protein
MGFLSHLFYPWGLLLQGLAIIHFIRRRPDTFWIWIILFLGPIGALIYIFAEVIPDAGLLQQSFKVFSRRNRIGLLEAAIRSNPSAGNYEELGDLYLENGKFEQARSAFDKAVAARSDTLDVFYRRGICALELDDPIAAIPDLERVIRTSFDYDFHRAAGLLAHAYALTGQREQAEKLFQRATSASVSSETYLNFATFLASEGRNAEARQWLQSILDKKASVPGYQRRRDRKWFRLARQKMKQLPS